VRKQVQGPVSKMKSKSNADTECVSMETVITSTGTADTTTDTTTNTTTSIDAKSRVRTRTRTDSGVVSGDINSAIDECYDDDIFEFSEEIVDPQLHLVADDSASVEDIPIDHQIAAIVPSQSANFDDEEVAFDPTIIFFSDSDVNIPHAQVDEGKGWSGEEEVPSLPLSPRTEAPQMTGSSSSSPSSRAPSRVSSRELRRRKSTKPQYYPGVSSSSSSSSVLSRPHSRISGLNSNVEKDWDGSSSRPSSRTISRQPFVSTTNGGIGITGDREMSARGGDSERDKVDEISIDVKHSSSTLKPTSTIVSSSLLLLALSGLEDGQVEDHGNLR